MMRKFIVLLFFILLLTISFAQEKVYLTQIDPESYILGPGDKIRVF